jgi:hypothetical protein
MLKNRENQNPIPANIKGKSFGWIFGNI